MHRHAHGPDGHAKESEQRRLRWVLALTLVYTVAEIAGGLASNSLALLADAGHMVTDDLALGLAVLAAWFASRPPDRGRTYGYQRAEILAALVNGIGLAVVCAFIFWEAIRRFNAPPDIRTGMMAWIGAGGLAVNTVSALLLHRHAHGLNARAARLHVLGDLFGSIGVLAASAAIALFGWGWADPVTSIVIGVIVVVSSIRLILDSVHVLMEGTPGHLDAEEIRRALAALQGVTDVHDLHVWSLGGRVPLLTAHLRVEHSARGHDVLRVATALLSERFAIGHVTLQIEPADFNIRGLPAPVDKGGAST
ncbi:MAG TPA: cation diffusion facilitator family transporter [Candidatus Polarisedimenticolaceae bacterium]|nr:cation diffusion facilitator family transporter [Candidatus Polarisedimenticolaceae bacterium]